MFGSKYPNCLCSLKNKQFGYFAVNLFAHLAKAKLIDIHSFDKNFNENFQKFGFINITDKRENWTMMRALAGPNTSAHNPIRGAHIP